MADDLAPQQQQVGALQLLRLAGSFGGSVYETLADRFKCAVSVVKAVWFPRQTPYTGGVDVTAGFRGELLRIGGGISLVDARISTRRLLSQSGTDDDGAGGGGGGAPASDSGGAWNACKRAFGFGGGGQHSPRGRSGAVETGGERQSGRERSVSPVAGPKANRGNLCVFFSIPGGAHYVVYYRLPEETVTFPPPAISGAVATLTPLERQIISAGLIAVTQGVEEEEEEELVLLDLTDEIALLAGPDGSFFGRYGSEDGADLSVAFALAASEGRVRLDSVLGWLLMPGGGRPRLALDYADGRRVEPPDITTFRN